MKNLNELVRDFQTMASELRGKINDRLNALEEEALSIKAEIEAKTSQLVTSELNDDAVAQGECRRSLYDLRQKLAETEGLIEAYHNEPNNPAHTAKALDAIRTAAARERAARLERAQALINDRKIVEQQFKNLEVKLNQLDTEINSAHLKTEERLLIPLLKYIEPRYTEIPEFSRERYISAWIRGDVAAIQSCLRAPRQPKEQRLTITHGELCTVAPEPAGPRCIKRTEHIFGESEVELPV